MNELRGHETAAGTDLYRTLTVFLKRPPPAVTTGTSLEEVIVKKYFCSIAVFQRQWTAADVAHLYPSTSFLSLTTTWMINIRPSYVIF